MTGPNTPKEGAGSDSPQEPAFDFDLIGVGEIPGANPEELAERVFWQLANELWRGDWLREGPAGPGFYYPKAELYDGTWTKATLHTNSGIHKIFTRTAGEEVWEQSQKSIKTCEITIEFTHDELLESFLLMAYKDWQTFKEEEDEDEDDDEGDEISLLDALIERHFDEDGNIIHTDGISARRGTSYTFNSMGKYDVDDYCIIETDDGWVSWDSRERDISEDGEQTDYEADAEDFEGDSSVAVESQPVTKQVITDIDITKIAIACEILDASSPIKQYLADQLLSLRAEQ